MIRRVIVFKFDTQNLSELKTYIFFTMNEYDIETGDHDNESPKQKKINSFQRFISDVPISEPLYVSHVEHLCSS